MDQKDQNVNVRIASEVVQQIDEQAAQEGRDRSGMIRWMIQRYLERER